MFSETLHKAIQGCGAHPAIRMTPVKTCKEVVKTQASCFSFVSIPLQLFYSLTLDWKLEGERTLQSKKQQRASHTCCVNL